MLITVEQLGDLWNLINKLKTKVFSIETQYKFLKLYKKLSEEIDIIDLQRQTIIEKYGERDSEGNYITDGQGVKIKAEYIAECKQCITELDALKIQLPDIYFSIDELSDLGLELQELMLMDPFIKI